MSQKKKKSDRIYSVVEKRKRFSSEEKKNSFSREPTSVGALKNPVSYTYNCVFEQLLSDFQRALRPKTG